MTKKILVSALAGLLLSQSALASLDDPYGFTDKNGQYWQFSCYDSNGQYIAAGYNNGCNGSSGSTDTGGNTDNGNSDTGNTDSSGNTDTGNNTDNNTDNSTNTDTSNSIASNPIMQMFETFFGGPLNSISEAMVSVMEPIIDAMLDMSDEILKMADEILIMADRIGSMAEKILDMADRIGEMADKIVQVQHSMSNLVASLFGSDGGSSYVGVSMVKPMVNDQLTSVELPVIELSNQATKYVLVISTSALFAEGSTVSSLVTDDETLSIAWDQALTMLQGQLEQDSNQGPLYLAVRAVDEQGNLSGMSNSAKVNVTIETHLE